MLRNTLCVTLQLLGPVTAFHVRLIWLDEMVDATSPDGAAGIVVHVPLPPPLPPPPLRARYYDRTSFPSPRDEKLASSGSIPKGAYKQPGTRTNTRYPCARRMIAFAIFWRVQCKKSSGAADAGLCATCVHMQLIKSDRGSTFYLCKRSLSDLSFPKYPRLPVIQCRGYESETSRDTGLVK